MDINKFSPFNNPQVRRKQQVTARASFKAFNSVATTLLEGLRRIYPNDAVLRLISNELAELIDPERKPPQFKNPALNFFREMRKPYTCKKTGKQMDYIDALKEHDETALEDPPVAMLKGIGISGKWKTMDEEQKKWVWAYLDKLIHLSAQAVYSSSTATDEMNQLSREVVKAAMAGKSNVESVVADPNVKKAAVDFINTLPEQK